MPLYGYECKACGHSFDRLQKLSDHDPEFCPVCSAVGVRRQLTAPAFRLSGSGWYETDFKKEGDRKRNLVDSGENRTETKAADTNEAKAAAKAEPATTTKSDATTAAKPAASSPEPKNSAT